MLGLAGPAAALDPTRAIRNFKHTAWTLEDGAPADIQALAQTPDGYLWLGTRSGLVRFDGRRFEPYQPQVGKLMSTTITSLLATPNGDLWIGYLFGGVSVLRHGEVTSYPLQRLAGVFSLALAGDQSIWATAAKNFDTGGLFHFDGRSWTAMGPAEGVPLGAYNNVRVTRDGAVWASAQDLVVVRPPGAHRFRALRTDGHRIFLGTGPEGRLWITDSQGTRPLSTRRAAELTDIRPAPTPKPPVLSRGMVVDRDGALWSTDAAGGVFRMTHPERIPDLAGLSVEATPDRFGAADRLTSSLAKAILEDREGDIWVGTSLGLDRFRASDIVPEPAITDTPVRGYVAAPAKDGGLYAYDADTLFHVGRDGVVRVVQKYPTFVEYLHTTHDGVTWLIGDKIVAEVTPQGVRPIKLPEPLASALMTYCDEDKDGRLLVSAEGKGVFRREADGRWTLFAPRPDLAGRASSKIVLDRSGALWFDFGTGALFRVNGDRVDEFGRASGLDIGHIDMINVEGDHIIVGGERGLAQFDGGRFRTITTDRVDAFSQVIGLAYSADGHTWVFTGKGLVRVASADLDRAFQAGAGGLAYRLYDFRDGLPGAAQQAGGIPSLVKGPLGRLWMLTNHGLAWIDPGRLTRNTRPPPTSIQSIKVGDRVYPAGDNVVLPPGSSNLQISYAAPSLAIPERVRVRYRLDGTDPAWVDASDPGHAVYTRLAPGQYRFQVIAANNDGVWNDTGATLGFTIQPTFFQSWIFAALCAVAGLAALWWLYALRLEQVSSRLRLGMRERMAERERIARELHDTFLQSVSGLILRFQAVAHRIPADQPARGLMEQALERADKVMAEGRDRVVELRATGADAPLAEAIGGAISRVLGGSSIEVAVDVSGEERPTTILAAEEIVRIADEFMMNTLRHAQARRVDVAIRYRPSSLGVTFRDDGIGIDPAVLATGRRESHFGLVGMRERAGRMKAAFNLVSHAGEGARLDLVVPGRIAFETPTRSWRSRLLEVLTRLRGDGRS